MLVVWKLQSKEFWVMVSEKHRKSKTLLILLVPNTKPQLAIKNSFLLLCIREDALVSTEFRSMPEPTTLYCV